MTEQEVKDEELINAHAQTFLAEEKKAKKQQRQQKRQQQQQHNKPPVGLIRAKDISALLQTRWAYLRGSGGLVIHSVADLIKFLVLDGFWSN